MNNITSRPETHSIRPTRLWLHLMGAALLLFCFDVRQAQAVAITLGPRIDLTPTTFALPIEITDAVGVSEWFLDITYDPMDVQVNLGCDPFGGDAFCSLFTGPVTEGDFFAAGAPFNLLIPGFVELDPITFTQSGRLFGMHGAYGGIPPAPSGSGVLAYVEFLILGTGDSPIEPDGEDVVSEPTPDPDPTPDPEPTPVPEPGTLALLALCLACFGGRWLYSSVRRARPAWCSPLLACVALVSLTIGGKAFAQLPPIVNLPEGEPPILTPAPPPAPPPDPPTVAPTAAAPYFVPPAWSQTLAPHVRFVILSNFNNEAVLDRETGLVWTRRTVADSNPSYNAESTCSRHVLGNRMGWRLPTVAELQSLLDLSVPSSSSEPRLPVGHPFVFTEKLLHPYWSADFSWAASVLNHANDSPTLLAMYRWSVQLSTGGLALDLASSAETGTRSGVLCVRGHRQSTDMAP